MSPDAPSATPPNSTAARDVAYHVHPFTELHRLRDDGPQVITRGDGIRVYDDSGRGYIEAMAGLWCASLGFSEPRLAEAGRRQLERLPFYHSYSGKTPDVTVELAERLIDLAPVPMSKVMFFNSGSEANETAIKLVRVHNNMRGRPEKKKIIGRKGAYHGATTGAGSLSGLAYVHLGFDLPEAGVLHTDTPHHYLYAEPGESEEDFATRLAGNLERLILEAGPETVGGFIAEPVMGAGGVIVPPATYFEKVQEVLAKYDVMFIADEVICGFGRTGNMWGSQTFDLRPDVITSAKALSAGCAPISAVLISEPIYQTALAASDKYGMFGHGSTYSGHPLSVAIALETQRIYAERDIVSHVRSIAPGFQAGLRCFIDSPLVGEVRGVGLVGAVQLVKDKTTKVPFEPSERVGFYLLDRALEYGVILRNLKDSIAFSPPLIITAEEIDEMFAAFGKALADTEAWVAAGMPRQ